MRLEINEIINEVVRYLMSAWVAVNPALTWIGSLLFFVLFPTETYITYSMIVGGVVVLDLITKYYSISTINGGFWKAIKSGKLSSNQMWIGTRKKIVSYFLIMILVGLSHRFELVQYPAEFLGTMAYAVMFWRESQSIVENMLDAGHSEFKLLQLVLKRKKKETLEKAGIVEEDGEFVDKKSNDD